MALLTALLFLLATAAALIIFYHAVANASAMEYRRMALPVVLMLLAWLLIQSVVTISGIYYKTIHTSVPPRIVVFGILPVLSLIIFLFTTRAGKKFADSLPLETLTWLHVVRVPVEIVLYLLFIQRAVPQLMTFEGRNFDILVGLSAPVVVHYAFGKGDINRRLLMVWNIAGLLLLGNIVIIALLSVPSPLQRLAFDRPNVSIVQFPYSWLPLLIVPVVLFSHLVALRQLQRWHKP